MWGIGGVSGSWNKGEMKRHAINYVGWTPHRKKQKEKILNILHYITASLSNMIDRVHLSSVEGHPTQAVISDQAWIYKEGERTVEFLRLPWILSQIPWWSVSINP